MDFTPERHGNGTGNECDHEHNCERRGIGPAPGGEREARVSEEEVIEQDREGGGHEAVEASHGEERDAENGQDIRDDYACFHVEAVEDGAKNRGKQHRQEDDKRVDREALGRGLIGPRENPLLEPRDYAPI